MEANTQPGSPFGYAGDVRVIGELACIIYDEEDGTVVHSHSAICLEGGEMPDEDAFQKRALELATQSQEAGARRLKTMMVAPADIAGPAPMRVDLGSMRLVPDERQKEPPRETYGRPETAA